MHKDTYNYSYVYDDYIYMKKYECTIMHSHSKVRRHHKHHNTYDYNTVGNGTITSLMMNYITYYKSKGSIKLLTYA